MSDRRHKHGLSRHFERVCAITLERRPARRERLLSHLRSLELDGGVQCVAAVDGRAEHPPEGWGAGPGAWGCRLSHLALLRQALTDGAEHVLVLEDDVIFSPHTAQCLPRLMQDLPESWGQFYLGGQHLQDPVETVTPLIWRATNINRTHAYAVHRRALPAVVEHLERLGDYLSRGQWHVDHQLGTGQSAGLWETCAPSWWLAGQAEGESDIAGNTPEERWWHHPRYAFHIPLMLVPGNTTPDPEWQRTLWFGPGEELPAMQSGADFARRCLHLSHEALIRGRLPALAADVPAEWCRCWPAGVRQWCRSLLPCPADYPFNALFPHPMAELLSQKT